MGLFSRKSNSTAANAGVSPVNSSSDAPNTPSTNSSVASGLDLTKGKTGVESKIIEVSTVTMEPPKSYYDSLPKLIQEHEKSELTEEQEKMYQELKTALQDPDFKLPVKNCTNWESEPEDEYISLTSWEKFYLTRECLLRFLVGCKWKYEHAWKKILETLVWRREFGLTYDDENFSNCIQPEDIEEENKTGKQILLGYDKQGHILLYMKDGLQNTNSSLTQVKHMIYMIESAILLNPKGCSKVVILVDFKHYPEVPGVLTKRKMTPLSIAKQCLHICQTYYPETLGYAVFINIPWLGWTFLKLMVPFVDPNTKKRLVFDEPFENYIDSDNLETIYGGNLNFTYNHDVYWPDFIEQCKTRRIENYNRFLEKGGDIGVSEFDIKP